MLVYFKSVLCWRCERVGWRGRLGGVGGWVAWEVGWRGRVVGGVIIIHIPSL